MPTSQTLFVFDQQTQIIYGCGRNTTRETGIDSKADIIFPPQKLSSFIGHHVIALAVGEFHVLLLTDQGLFLFGRNILNDDSPTPPIKIPFFKDHKVMIIAAGTNFSHVATNLGLFSFGHNDKGQLGLGDRLHPHGPTQNPFFDNPAEILQISSAYHTLFLTSKGVFGCGCNEYGQLGIGHNFDAANPVPLEFEFTADVVQVGCGCEYSLILTRNNGLFAVGENHVGQCGLGNTIKYNTPQKITTFSDSEVLSISCGGCHSLVQTAHRGFFAMGGGDSRSGLLKPEKSLLPHRIEFFAKDFGESGGRVDSTDIIEFMAGGSSSYFLTKKGLFSCGFNDYCQLGVAKADTTNYFVQVSFFDFADFTRLTFMKASNWLSGSLVLFTLLLSRTFDPQSPLHKDNLPIDLFKLLVSHFLHLPPVVPSSKTMAFVRKKSR